EFRHAGPLVRAAAWLIDCIAKFLILIVVYIVANIIIDNDNIVMAGQLIVGFLMIWIIDIVFEWAWSGFTPGKKALGIRVIGANGLPAGFAACFIRNTLRWADWLPFGFGIGLISMFCSSSFRRLGDLAGGTLVIYEQNSRIHRPPIIKNKKVDRMLAVLPPETVGYIDPDSARAIAQYASSRLHYHPDRRDEIASHLSQPLAEKLDLDNSQPDIVLSAIYMKLFHDSDEQNMGAKAAQFISKRRKNWNKLERMIEPLKASDRARAVDLAQEYRSACADLALADAYQLPPQNISYLHGLVSRGHLLFYKRVQVRLAHIIQLLCYDVPARLIRDRCLHISAACFFGSFILCIALAYLVPQIAEQYIGENDIARMVDMYSDSPNDRSADDAAYMSGFYIANNVGIAFSCFAFGIFAGIGSIILLLFNGIYLGLVFGYMASSQVDSITQAHFFEFVRAHGPFELCGIMLAGAAGLRLGIGIIICNGLPRLESLQKSARLSTPLMCIAGLSVAAAAPIEAFISPSSLTLTSKTVVAIICTIILLLYFSLGFRKSAHNKVMDISS
ncbi:MAG: stage II sporulation protein M, partial [Planctomycetes bacterium]|nr:stage II sporulation protein M [Planctomycetota bacterium]